MIIYAHLIAIIDVVHFFNSIACGPVSASEDPASLVHVDVEGPLLASPSALPADNGENLYATVMEIGSKLDKRTWMSTEEVNAAIWQCMLNWVEAYVPQNMFQTEDQIKKVHEQCQKRFEVYSGRVKKKANAPYSTPQPASKPKSDPKSATAPKAQHTKRSPRGGKKPKGENIETKLVKCIIKWCEKRYGGPWVPGRQRCPESLDHFKSAEKTCRNIGIHEYLRHHYKRNSSSSLAPTPKTSTPSLQERNANGKKKKLEFIKCIIAWTQRKYGKGQVLPVNEYAKLEAVRYCRGS